MLQHARELDDGESDMCFGEESIDFFTEALTQIERISGIKVRFVLWLADLDSVTDSEWYGRDMLHSQDYDSYELGPVILSDIGYDGTLYGYPILPEPVHI